MPLLLPIHPGLVSVFYFVFLDLVLLTTLDTALSRLLSHLYYRHIYSGRPLLLRTCDVPGITSFLLGRRLALVNVTAVLVKLVFMAFVFMLDLNILSDNVSHVRLLTTFEVNMTDKAWRLGPSVDIKHRYASMKCSVVADPSNYRIGDGNEASFNDSIIYYHLAFNLSKGYEFTKNETLHVNLNNDSNGNGWKSPAIFINHDTLHCLRPSYVTNPKPLIRVLGCSSVDRYGNYSCRSYARSSRPAASLSFTRISKALRVAFAGEFIAALYQFNTLAELQPVFPEYVGPGKQTRFLCMKQQYVVQRATIRGPSRLRVQTRTSCVLIMRHNGTTLFERWAYHRGTNTVNRTFAGPIFDRDLDVGLLPLVDLLAWNSPVDINWREFSQSIVTDALVYVFEPMNVGVIGQGGQVTKIPTGAVVVFVFMTVVIVVIRVVVSIWVERGNMRPQLNLVDGVSSIGREELHPTGSSVMQGQPMVLGFRQKTDAMLHFGSLANTDDAVKIIKGVDIL